MKQALGHHHVPIKTFDQLILRSGRFLGHVAEYCRELGPRVGFQWYCGRIRGRLPIPTAPQIVIKPRDLLHPVTVGLSPISDEYVFNELFVHHAYAPVCERLPHQSTILDLGANVGYASAYFASRYPAARILAVEPDPRNFDLCCENLKPYGDRIKVLNGAVWSCCSKLALSYSAGGGMDTQVRPAENRSEAQVEAWDVPTLLDIASVKTVDLLKIDIEGSEAELFAKNTAQWLPRVRNICIELHHQRCREHFFNALSEFHYELIETGESTICLNLRGRQGLASTTRRAGSRAG
jgi:FkbM family methyltransferase